MTSPKFNSVDDYLKSLDSPKEKTLRTIIEFILARFPELDAKISWNVPQVHRNGEYVFGVSALKNHLALAPWSTEVIDNFKNKLEKNDYVVRKNLFQVPVDWEMDKNLIEDLVRARLGELS